MYHKIMFIVLATIFVLFPINYVLADTVFLKDGSKVIGDITDETKYEVTIESSMGFIVIPRDRILSIQYDDPLPTQTERISDVNWGLHKEISGWGLLSAWGATVAGVHHRCDLHVCLLCSAEGEALVRCVGGALCADLDQRIAPPPNLVKRRFNKVNKRP